MNRSTTALSRGLAVLVAATMVAGCGSSGGGAGDGSAEGVTLRVAVDNVGPEDLDPLLYQASAQQAVYSLIYDPLIAVGPDAQLAPGLAESWEPTDDTTWTITLREGAVFHDGSPVTAEDAKFSLERYVAGSGVGATRMAAYVDKVTAVDDLTLEVTTKTPSAAFPYDIAIGEGTAAGFVVPKAAVEEMGEEAFNKDPIGSGPFEFESLEAGRGMDFSANEDYWGTVPKVDALELQIVADQNARLNLVRSGEVDIISGLLGPSVTQAESDSNLVLTSVEKSSLTTLQVGGQGNPDSPLSKPEVRQAISLAIDRQGIVDNLLAGYGAPAPLFAFPRGLGWPDDADSLVDPLDLDQAKELLADAGYPDGFELTLVAATTAADMADAMAQTLSQIGIKVDQRIEDIGAVLDEFYSPEGHEATRVVLIFGPTGHGSRIDESSVNTTHFDPASPAAQYGGADDILELLKAQAVTVDPVERASLIQQVLMLNQEQKRVIPMWFADSVFAATKDVTGWEPVPAQPYPSNLQSVSLAG